MAFIESFYTDWIAISIAISALSVVACTMLIMLSRIFGLRTLEQVAKSEFVYAASTVFIVMTIGAIIGVVEPVLSQPSGSMASCMYAISLNPTLTGSCTEVKFSNPSGAPLPSTLIDWMKKYMEAPAKCVQRTMNVLYTLEIPIGVMTSIYMEIFMSEHASGFGVKWLEERIINTAQSLSFYMYVYYIIVHMFNFVKYYAGFFFSIGVVLRAFPPTRGAGAYVMALAFGLYFIFPLAYITSATVFLPHVKSDVVNPSATNVQYACILPDASDLTMLECGVGSVSGRATQHVNAVKANYPKLIDMLTIQVDSLSKHIVFAICIFPLIAFTVLLTFVLNATSLFGGNIPEIGRGLVKLI
jgi:hypothetical protein